MAPLAMAKRTNSFRACSGFLTSVDVYKRQRELHRVRADKILEVVTLSAGFLDVEAELRFFTGTVKVVENAEPFVRFQLHTLTTEPPKVGDQVSTHTGKVVSRFLHILLAHRNGDVLLLNDSVCTGCFIKEHPIVLLTVLVKSIALQGEKNGFLKVCTVQTAVVDVYKRQSEQSGKSRQ